MVLKPILALALLCGFGLPAMAGEAASALPLLAVAPPASPAAPSLWSGFYVGSEMFATSGSGALKGGVGGAVDFGYTHEFSNNLIVGVGGAVGYAPALFRNSLYTGFDVAATNVKIGYDMGRLVPYVSTGLLIEKAHTTGPAAGYTGASDAVNGLFSGSSNLKAAGTVSAGFNYAVTDTLTVGMEAGVTMGRNPGFLVPGALGSSAMRSSPLGPDPLGH